MVNVSPFQKRVVLDDFLQLFRRSQKDRDRKAKVPQDSPLDLLGQGGDRRIVPSDGSDADVGPSRDALSKAYSALAEVWSIAKSQSPELREQDLDFMLAVRADGLLDAYLFLEEFRESWRSDFEKWKQENRDQARRYFQTHLLVHKPRQP